MARVLTSCAVVVTHRGRREYLRCGVARSVRRTLKTEAIEVLGNVGVFRARARLGLLGHGDFLAQQGELRGRPRGVFGHGRGCGVVGCV